MFDQNYMFSYIIILILFCGTSAQTSVIVNTTKGQITGKISTVQTIGIAEDRSVSKFLGVPYARPPVGNLRFKAPEPHEEWEGVRNATSYGNACSQTVIPGLEAFGYLPGPYGDEDCLFLNVFVPGDMKNITEPLSVMVWIPGGGFFQGFSHFYDPTLMVLHGNVIMVTLNYRLGALGFLSIGDSSLTSSNNALRDQIMALKWVKGNIANFGGNPDHVTIFGESAGSISVKLLLVSPLSKGLFKRAIAQSGPLNILPIQNKCRSKEQFSYADKSLIPKSNCTKPNVSETIACLKEVSLHTILAYEFDGYILASYLENQFIPCYGDDIIPRNPLELFKGGQMHVDDVIIGGNNDEGSYTFNPFFPVDKTMFEKSLEYLIKTFYPVEWERVYAAVIHEYSPYDQTIPYNRQLLNAQTDRLLADYQVLADEIRKSSYQNVSVYHYIFNYSPKYMQTYPNWIQGGHAEEISLEFLNILDPNFPKQLNVTIGSEDIEVATFLLTTFTNFAKTGDPNDASLSVTWPQYDVNNRQSLEITLNMTSDNIKANPRRKAMDFWNNLVPLLAASAVPTTNRAPVTPTYQVAIGPLKLTAEEANRTLWGLGLSLGFVTIFGVITVAALLKCYRDNKSVNSNYRF